MIVGRISTRLRDGAEALGARWLVGLPARGSSGATPGILLVDRPAGTVLWWDERHAGIVDIERGRTVRRIRLPGPVAGLGDDGMPRIARDGGWARLDPEAGRLAQATDGPVAVRRAADTPEAPEIEPFVNVGRRRYRARLKTTARVTRHVLEVCDEGHPPREREIASYTLRSDRLELQVHGGGLVRGTVGTEPLAPVASVVGRDRDAVLVVRRRFDAWHEHVAGQTIDLVGHGPATLELVVIPEGPDPPRAFAAGPVDEAWEGLDRRGPGPPAMVRGLGVVAIGLLDDVAVVELIDVAAPRGDRARLVARRRALAGLPLPGGC